jgi:hypothetical protein
MRSEGNAPKNGEPSVGFPSATMLQHTSRFWAKIFFSKAHFARRTNHPLTTFDYGNNSFLDMVS